MYNCILHSWYSHDGPCPSCHTTITTSTTELPTTPSTSTRTVDSIEQWYNEWIKKREKQGNAINAYDMLVEFSAQQPTSIRWVKASERLPEGTYAFSKQIVTRWQFNDGMTQMRTTTINQFLDAIKLLTDLDKLEWLDEKSITDGRGNG